MSSARVFERIWAENRWGDEQTRSGPGATVETTRRVAEVLPSLMDMLGARSFLDLGCGESLWMPPVPGYVGVDICDGALSLARALHPDRTYRLADMLTMDIPETDVVFSRYVMCHIPPSRLVEPLGRMLSACRWFMATTFQDGSNEEIAEGGFYEVDLCQAPFHLGEPLLWIRDDWRNETARIGVWRGLG